jgi:NhaA family Na+:H+ antiporter
VLALLGRRAPLSLKVFVLALAIVDDLGAILVIAIFYTESISLEAVIWAVLLAATVVLVARMGVRSTEVYIALGILFWAAVFKSGIHATLAGVVLAMLTPARPHFTQRDFEASALDLLVSYRYARDRDDGEGAQQVLNEFENLSRGTEPPLDRLEHLLHPWVSYLIVPVFALANAGVALSGDAVSNAATSPVSLGIATGLVLGKPLGILVACFIAVRLGAAELPESVGYGHVLGVGLIAGIGFTVSLFITDLAFDTAALVDDGKLGILAASTMAGILGFIYLWFTPAGGGLTASQPEAP